MTAPSPTDNPYAAPSAPVLDTHADPEIAQAEEERRAHLHVERSVLALGWLYIAVGCFTAFGLVGVLLAPTLDVDPGVDARLITAAVGSAMMAAWIGIGAGLVRLRPRARPFAIGISVIGLLAFPIGTIFSAYFLYLLASKKGQRVLSPQWQAVRDATPHVRHRMTVVTWLLAGFALLFFVGVIAAVVT